MFSMLFNENPPTFQLTCIRANLYMSWNELEVTFCMYREIQNFLFSISWWTAASVFGTLTVLKLFVMTWTRNAKLTRLITLISFKIWHRYAPRNTTRNATRNATSFWISPYIQKVTSGSYQGDVLTHIDWALISSHNFCTVRTDFKLNSCAAK